MTKNQSEQLQQIREEDRAVDIHVGRRVRARRIPMGLNQTELGAALGLTFQQIQKYERGLNRISASKLQRLSAVLDVPVAWFFDGMKAEEGADKAAEGPYGREVAMFIRALENTRNTSLRTHLLGVVDSLASEG